MTQTLTHQTNLNPDLKNLNEEENQYDLEKFEDETDPKTPLEEIPYELEKFEDFTAETNSAAQNTIKIVQSASDIDVPIKTASNTVKHGMESEFIYSNNTSQKNMSQTSLAQTKYIQFNQSQPDQLKIMEEQIIDDYIEENIEPVEFEGAKQDMDSKEQLEN